MQTHALAIDEFGQETYTLIAIHTALEEYKLAYLLNKALNTRFTIAAFKLDFESKHNSSSFTVYEYCNDKFDIAWFLIANTCKTTLNKGLGGLNLATETKSYLINEQKNVDFFIKINEETDHTIVHQTIEKINTINQVVTSYSVDPNSLKSKDFLIF